MREFLYGVLCMVTAVVCFRDAALAYQASQFWSLGIDIVMGLFVIRNIK